MPRRVKISAELLEPRETPATLDSFLTAQHSDISLGFTGTDWNLVVIDQDPSPSVVYQPDRALLYAGVNTLTTRPAGAQFDFLGTPAGGDVYMLPQSQNPDQLFLGIAGYGIGAGAIDQYDATTESKGRALGQARWAKLTVVNVVGPGHFSMFQSGAFGDPIVAVATYNDGVANPNAQGLDVTDGLSADDAVYIISGGHAHYNYAFTAPGRYEVTFRASGYLENGNNATPGTPTVTRDFTVYFSVANVGNFSLAPAAVSVNEGAGTATITVTRTGGSDGRVTINYATSDGTATAGSDYTTVSGTLTFNDLETHKTFTIPISEDAAIEGDETVNLTLSVPGPASIAGFNVGLPGGSMLGTPATGTLTIVDNDDPDLPTITPIADRTTPENTPVAVGFTIGDDDGIPGLTVTVTSSNPAVVPNTPAALSVSPPNGSAVASRTLTITPATGMSGVTTITITVMDGGGASTVETFLLTVTPVSDAPIPVADSYGVTPGNVLRGNVLLNDDPGIAGGPLTASLVTGPTQGTVVLNANGTFTFTPVAGFTGIDSFTYRATGPDGSAVATVSITARPVDPGIVNVLSGTDTDIGIAYESGELEPHIHDEAAGVEYEPDEGIFDVSDLAATTQPAGAEFAFIGAPVGSPIWVLPQTPIGGLLYLGLAAEEINPANNEFVNDEVFLRVTAVDGPGNLSIWTNGVTPTVLAASSDGITVNDAFRIPAGSHFHANWGFTARGLYAISMQAYGTLDDGNGTVVESPVVTYYFAVDPQNTAPVVSGPASVQVFSNTPFAFTGANLVTVTDAESSPGDYTVVVTATNGTVSLGGTGGSGASVTLTETLAEINAALAELTFTPDAGFVGDAVITITVTDPGFLVGTGNAESGSRTIQVTVAPMPDNTAPTVSISSPSSPAVSGGTVTYTVTYADENLASVTLTAADVMLNTTGTATGTVSVSGTGNTRTVTISNISGDGSLGISIAAGTAVDAAGNTAPAAGPAVAFAVDNTAPIVTIGPPSVLTTGTGPVIYTVTFSDPNFAGLTFTAADVTLNRTGTANGTVSVSTDGGLTRTVTISGITGNGSLSISIAAGTVFDLAGNIAPAVGPSAPVRVDNAEMFAVGGADGVVRILDGSGVELRSFRPLDVPGSPYTGLVQVALGDFNLDGIADFFVAAANPVGVLGLDASKAGKVFVFDGASPAAGTTPTLLREFVPFANHMGPGPDGTVDSTGPYTNGLNIAVGDVNGDGRLDLIAGTRGGSSTAGRAAYGRLAVIDGTSPVGTNLLIGDIVSPFGPGYQKGVVVAAGDLDRDGRDEIAVTRGGPVAASNPNKTLKLKAYQLRGGSLVELALAGTTGGPLAPFAGITGADGSVIARDARLTFVDRDGDGRQELVISALDPISVPGNTHIRIAAFTVDTVTGLANAIGTGSGPSKSYLIGGGVVDHSIAMADVGRSESSYLAVIIENQTPEVRFLDPMTGAPVSGGFPLNIVTGGISINGL